MRFLFPLSLILIAGILFFVVVNPIYSDVSQLRIDVAAYNVALDNSTNLQKTRDQLVDLYKNIKQEDKDRLSHFLPNTVNNIRFILEIEQIANLHSMPIENIKFQAQTAQATEPPKPGTPTTAPTVINPNDPSASKPYGTFPIEFSTTGNYETFGKFLKDIEHNLRLVNIKSISFAVPSGVGVDPNVYDYSLKVETYWLK